MIANNGGRLGKTLWTEREAGEKVRVMGVWDGPEEARFVGERIEPHIAGGGRAEDCAILVRAQFQTRQFEASSISIGLPYPLGGGFRFYQRAELPHPLAFRRAAPHPAGHLASSP